jgi:hypothetical protein
MLAYLPPATYIVSIRDTLSPAFVKNDVPLVAGKDQDLGSLSITWQGLPGE